MIFREFVIALIVIMFLSFVFVSCTTTGPGNVSPNAQSSDISSGQTLDWNSSSHPERQAWTDFLINLISSDDVFKGFDKPSGDSKKLCSKYDSFTKEQKVHMWASLVVADAYFESGWDPTSHMNEALGTDRITGQQVRSEGLLQLSYGDVDAYPFCNKFDWSHDKSLAASDAHKTIFSAPLNLDCGVRIMSQLALKHTGVFFTKTYYWSTLVIGGKYGKVDEIIKRVKKAESCE